MGWIISTPFFSHKKPHTRGRLPDVGQRVRSENPQINDNTIILNAIDNIAIENELIARVFIRLYFRSIFKYPVCKSLICLSESLNVVCISAIDVF